MCSRPPNYEPLYWELQKMQMYICISNHIKLVHMSGVHCQVSASSASGCDSVHLPVQHCTEHSGASSLFQAQSVQTSVKAAAMQLVVLAGDLG